MLFAVNFAQADNLFPNSNPFPQTTPQSMNNIYESEPSVIIQEQKQAKKSLFKKGKNLQQSESQNYVVPESKVINEGANNDSFYLFK